MTGRWLFADVLSRLDWTMLFADILEAWEKVDGGIYIKYS